MTDVVPASPGSTRLDRRAAELAVNLVGRGREAARAVPDLVRRLLAEAVGQVYAEPIVTMPRTELERRLATTRQSRVADIGARVPAAALLLRASRVGRKIPVAKAVAVAVGALDLATVVRTGIRDLQELVRYLRAARPDLPPERVTRLAVTAYLSPSAREAFEEIPLSRLGRSWSVRAFRGTTDRKRRRLAAGRARAAERLGQLA